MFLSNIIVQVKSVCRNRKCTDEKDCEKTRGKSWIGNEGKKRSPMADSGGVSGNERPEPGSIRKKRGGLYIDERQQNALS